MIFFVTATVLTVIMRLSWGHGAGKVECTEDYVSNITNAGDYPFMATVVKNTDHSMIASAVLLSVTHALTKPVAQFGINVKEVICEAGQVDAKDLSNKNRQYRLIMKYADHPKSGMLSYDFSLLTVEKPFVETKFVKPINIAGEDLKDGAKCISVSYPADCHGKSFMRSKEVTTSKELCTQYKLEKVTCVTPESMLCSDPDTLGGPLINQEGEPKIYGIFTGEFDQKCIYANTVASKDWIRRQMNNEKTTTTPPPPPTTTEAEEPHNYPDHHDDSSDDNDKAKKTVISSGMMIYLFLANSIYLFENY